VRQFKDRGTDEQSYAEPSFYVSSMATDALVLNHCPLYTKDGGQIQGGLVKAGGSTLVMSGTVLRQWAGAGLASSDAYVAHFDLPGGTFVSSGAMFTVGTSVISGVVITNGNIGSLVIGGSSGTAIGYRCQHRRLHKPLRSCRRRQLHRRHRLGRHGVGFVHTDGR
jgi:hypothetical protein